MEIDPDKLSSGERYKLLIGGVTPRPIAFVTSCSSAGVVNLAPFSFFNAAGPSPMTLMFVPVTRDDGTDKDTLRNVRPPEEGGTGEFVVNLAVETYARHMAATAEPLPYEESELERVGFGAVPSTRVQPPRVAGSPIAYECVTSRIVELDPGRPGSGNVVFGRVVHVHVDDAVIDDGYRIDPERVATIGRMGGRGYTRTRERFEITSGLDAVEAAAPFPEDTGTD